jgi:hypothetical protein
MKFRHYRNIYSMGNWYLFGLNLYKDDIGWTLDLIAGKHMFAIKWGNK